LSKNFTRTGFLNDFHSGSNVSLMHEDAYNSDGERHVEMNKYQEGLWEHFKKLAKSWRGIDCLILNGDLCELMMARNRMTECWSGNPVDQVINVVKLISMIKPKKCYIVRGTPYHVDADGLHVEELVGQYLTKGVDGDDVDTGKYSQYNIDPVVKCVKYRGRYALEARLVNLAPKEAEPRIWHVTHHMGSTGAWQYRGTAPSKAMSTLMLNESSFIDRKVWKRIFGIARAHVHHFWYEESASRVMLVNPAWQLQTPFMFKVMPENVPDIGGVEIFHHADGHFEKKKYIMENNVNRPPVFRAFD
jgi:hypothetical protein